MGIADVIALAEQGDVGCRRLIEDTAEAGGRGLALVGAAINPALILIGGRLARAGSMFFGPLEANFNKYSLVKHDDVAPEDAPASRRPAIGDRPLHGRGRAGAAALWETA